jgi:hypothetical protein
MIYVIGDSFSFGYNFFRDGVTDRKDIIYSTILSKKLNLECKNLSMPGGSNWRTARIIQSLPLTKNDFVIIAWSESMRFELGNLETQILPNDVVIKTSDIEQLEDHHKVKMLGKDFPIKDFVEKNDKVLTRRLFPSMIDSLDQIKNHNFKNIAEKLYLHYADFEWLENMFLLMFTSVLYNLNKSECKFIMFNSHTSPYSQKKDILDIPQYFLGVDGNMCKFIRNNNNIDYWNKNEHILVAEALYNYKKEIYSE